MTNTGPDIRLATPADAPLLAELGARTFCEAFAAHNTEADMAAYLASAFGSRIQASEIAEPGTVFLIAETAGEAVGYARLRFADSPPAIVGERPAEIVRFYVDPPWIGRGVAPVLMAGCLQLARERAADVVWLDVWERNARAIAFYRKWGFAKVGTARFPLGDDVQDDILMARRTTMTPEEPRTSHVCVFGVGGVGGYFGGRLAAWLDERRDQAWQVHFVARGEHLTEIRRHGLVLKTPEARLTCRPTTAADSMDDMPTPDIVLVCVKSYSLDEAIRQVAEHRCEGTVVIPLLNGVDIHARIRAQLRSGLVLPACVFVGTHVEAPGIVSQEGGDGVIFMGSDPDRPDYVPEAFLELLDGAGIAHRWFDDPRPAIWEKYLFISAFGLVTAASGMTLGQTIAEPRLLEDVRGIMSEVALLAGAEGVPLGPDAIGNALAKAEGFPLETKTSLQRDVEAGNDHEGDLFGGTILRLGTQHGIPTPVTERVYAQVRAQAE